MNIVIFLWIYFAVINLTGFVLMGIDKRRAQKRAFRISEATLFSVAIIGGSIGSMIGMYTFHHKTRHRSFVFGMPLILIIQIAIIAAAIHAPIEIAIL